MYRDRDQSCDEITARSLSFTQWEFLAEHFNGDPRPICYDEMRTRNALIARGLIRGHPRQAAAYNPKFTVLTEKGHGVMCAAMGMMADMLIAMHGTETETTMRKYGYGQFPTPASDQSDGELSLLAKDRR